MPHGAVPFPFGHCRICNDKATGFHYGVATCEGCKGFFKRSIPKGDKYTCFFGGQCNITPFNRNRCKACRFKRCLDNGMAIDAVKMGRIPKVEKERALLEAGLQTNALNSMDVDTEESVPNPELSHNEWVNSEPDQASHVLQVTKDGPMCKQSLSLNTLSTHCKENDMASSRAQMFPPPEWKSSDGKGSSAKCSSQQLGFESRDTCLSRGRNDASLQRQPHIWNCESVRTHKETLLERSGSLNEEIGTLSSLVLSSSSPTLYENQFSSQAEGENCITHSFKDQLAAGSEINTQGNIFYLKHSTAIVHPQFLKTSEVKTEPGTQKYNSVCDKETVHCDNPFAQPSYSFGCQGMKTYSHPTPLVEMIPTKVFDNKPDSFSTPAEVVRKCTLERLGGEVYMESIKTHCESSCESFGCKKSTQGEADVDSSSREDSKHHFSPKIYRQSCYSPDVIKVLMDQVGEERMKGIKQHIMTTIAKTFGPGECEATAQLLTSYTSSSRQQENLSSDFLQQSHNNGLQNSPSVSECSKSFVFESTAASSIQHPGLQGEHILPSDSIVSLSTHYQRNANMIGTSSRHTVTEHLRDMITLTPTHPGFKVEHCNRLPHPFSEHQESNLSECAKRMEVSSKPNSAHYSSTSLEAKDFELHNVESFCGHNDMDTTEGCFTSNVCSAVALSGQFFTEEYDAGKVRSSDKASVSSNSQNSSSDKDSSSPDTNSFDDLTMAESSLTLSAAYEKHMVEISKRYDRMQDYIQNKKVIPIHPLTPEGKRKVYDNLIAAIPNINKCIIGFSQDIPGMATLPKEDKEILMKRGYYDIWMLANSRLFQGDESYLQFADGTFYTRAWMETILNVMVVQKFISFAKKFNSLALSDLETAILCAIQLTSSNHEQMDLKCPESIRQMNSHFIDLLVQEIFKQHPSNCSRILVDIFRLMPDLAEINMMQQEIIANFSTSEPPEKVEYKQKEVPMADISDTDLTALADS